MNLTIDLGNTKAKAAVFDKGKMLKKSSYTGLPDIFRDRSLFEGVKYCIIASVVNAEINSSDVPAGVKSMRLFSSTPLPISLDYKSPQTLGSDRICAAAGSNKLYPSSNVLSIDAGTCIKYDLVTSQGHYLGGGISPGLQMRLNALNHFTQKLPLIGWDQIKAGSLELIGNDTTSSIISGAILGAVYEIERTMEEYKTKFPSLQIILTGGDSAFLAKQLKNRFFAEPDLVMIGLNAILEHNIEK